MPLVSLLLAPEEQSTEQNQDKSQRFIKGFVLKVWYKYKNNSCYECGQTFCALFWLLFISYSVPSVVYTHKHKHTHTYSSSVLFDPGHSHPSTSTRAIRGLTLREHCLPLGLRADDL